ncbi:MAG: ferritin [Desulfomonilaceae bacterium]
MMISQDIQDAFNGQLNAELYSAYLYLSMSAYFEAINLKGFANWMRCQAQEEMVHVMKFYNFINDRGGRVVLSPVEGPPAKWDSPLSAFEDAYLHEQKITGLINNLVDLALLEKDHAAGTFLQWFVTEQVEEEASADAVVQKLKLAGTQGAALFMIDAEQATRVFTVPPELAAQ